MVYTTLIKLAQILLLIEIYCYVTLTPMLSKEYGSVIILYWALLHSMCPRSFAGIRSVAAYLRY